MITLLVEDNGIGIDSIKEINKAESTGIHLINLMVDQLKGTIQYHTDEGTKVKIEYTPDIIEE